ncbi:MAG: MFS transporter, partial [Spirochaetia bacterium]|nr:MFS transporter [Spirochaetia bacterium]
KDTIISSAAKNIGTGKGFAIQEVLDQFGALIGPLIFAGYFALTGGGTKGAVDYRHAYGLFWIPYALVMIFVIIAYLKFPDPTKLEPLKKPNEPDKITKLFWVYNIFSFATVLGFVNYALMGFHFKSNNIVSDTMIPILYAVAMITDAFSAVVMGHWYDALKKKTGHHAGGLLTLASIPVMSALIPFLAFTNNAWLAFTSAILWGVVMGAHETVMKAGIADTTPMKKRGTGYGIFNFNYGLAMLAGGWLAGMIYEVSLPALCWGIAGVQVIAFCLFLYLEKEIKTAGTAINN